MKFTSDIAAAMQAKSRKAIAERDAAAKAEHDRLVNLVANIAPADVMPEYQGVVLARVRMQLDMINARLTEQLAEEPLDPQAIDRLANAQSRLAEQERILAGRPLPGSRKPAPDRPAKRHSAPTPQPVVDEAPRVNDPNEPNG